MGHDRPWAGNPDVNGMVVTVAPDEGVRFHLATTAGVWSYGGACTQRLVNPGFELDAAWQFPLTPYTAGYYTATVHSGNRARVLHRRPAANVRAYSSSQQTVTIPADAISATLSVWLYPISAEGELASTAAIGSGEALAAVTEVENPDGLSRCRDPPVTASICSCWIHRVRLRRSCCGVAATHRHGNHTPST